VIFNTILRLEERVLKYLLLLLTAIVVAAAQAEAGFYSWTDAEGREFYTNELDNIPSAYRATAKPVDVRDDRVSTGREPVVPSAERTVRVRLHKDRNGRGEAYWKKRAENLRQKIRKRQAERERIVKQGQDAEAKHPVPTKADRKARKDRERKLKKIDQDIAHMTRKLDVELPEEARKADALPGWVR
jgi:hypothetical protein